MSRLPALSFLQVKRALESAGFVEHRVRGKGRHRAFLHPIKRHLPPVVVPYGKSIKRGTARAIIRQAGLTVEEFLALL